MGGRGEASGARLEATPTWYVAMQKPCREGAIVLFVLLILFTYVYNIWFNTCAGA